MCCVRQRKSLALSKYVRVRICVCVCVREPNASHFAYVHIYYGLSEEGKKRYSVVLFQTIGKHTHTQTHTHSFTLAARASLNMNIFAYGGVAGGALVVVMYSFGFCGEQPYITH